MPPKPGYKTTEFWITAVVNIVAAIVSILVIRDLMTPQESELYVVLAKAIAGAVVPLVAAYVNGRYINARAAVKAGS